MVEAKRVEKMIFVDARIPVLFAPPETAGEHDAVLREGDGPSPLEGHAPACACCVPRSELGKALGALFLARARGEVAPFRRVIAVVTDPVAARAAIEADPLAAGRFRVV